MKGEDKIEGEETMGMDSQQEECEVVNFEDFNHFLMGKIGKKYAEGLHGLQDRFVSVFNQIASVSSITQRMHWDACIAFKAMTKEQKKLTGIAEGVQYIESMLTVVHCIEREYQEAVCIDYTYTEHFLSTIQERLEFLFTTAMALEAFQPQPVYYSRCIKIKSIIQLSVSPGIIEIQKRASLCLPLLLYLTQTYQKYCQPITEVAQRISRLRSLKDEIAETRSSQHIENFLMPHESHSSQKSKREQIFEEINSMVSFVKRLEFQIKQMIETPLRMFQLINQSKQTQAQKKQAVPIKTDGQRPSGTGQNLLNEDLKTEEVRKIEKFAQLLGTGDQCGIVEQLIQVNQAEFFQVMQLLENQRKLTEKHNMLPLVRERVETLHVLVVHEFKEYLERARKMHQRLCQMQEFELPPELETLTGEDRLNFISQKEIGDLINALKLQHELINETETTFELYRRVKERAEEFYRLEFCTDYETQPFNGVASGCKQQSGSLFARCAVKLLHLVSGEKSQTQNDDDEFKPLKPVKIEADIFTE